MVTYISSSSTHKSYLAILSKSYMSSSVLCKSLALLSSSEEAVLFRSPKFPGDDVFDGTLFCGDPNDTLFFVFNCREASLKDEKLFLSECN